VNLFKEEQPQICLMGATVIGRDLGPRVSSALTSGLTADCTSLEIGDHEDKKEGKTYLLHASSKGKQVMISSLPLQEYMEGIDSQSGIMLARAAKTLAE
jgi:electron transfer flavoprotein alpha subunit